MIEVIANDRMGRKGACHFVAGFSTSSDHDSPGQMSAYRYGRRPEKVDRGSDRYDPPEDPAQEMVRRAYLPSEVGRR